MATIKKKLKIFLKACWGPRIGPKAIAVALKGVGLEKSGHVIMHSALSKCGYLVGGGVLAVGKP